MGEQPPASLGLAIGAAATLSDGLPDVPASRRAVFRVDRRPANIARAPTELVQSGRTLLYLQR